MTRDDPVITPDPVLGFYGPGSQMWRVNREAVLLGAGPAALLLQVAHPLIAEGVGNQPQLGRPLACDYAPRRLVPVENHGPLPLVDDNVAVDGDRSGGGVKSNLVRQLRYPTGTRQAILR